MVKVDESAEHIVGGGGGDDDDGDDSCSLSGQTHLQYKKREQQRCGARSNGCVMGVAGAVQHEPGGTDVSQPSCMTGRCDLSLSKAHSQPGGKGRDHRLRF